MLRLRVTLPALFLCLVTLGPLTPATASQPYAWSPVAVQQPPATMHPGATVLLTVVVRNDGTQTWHGENEPVPPVRLGAADPRDRSSVFALHDATWLWSSGRRIRMETTLVPPGALAVFTFTFRAPVLPSYPQTFNERFAPLVEGGPWMDSALITLSTQVRPAASAAPPLPAPPAVDEPTVPPVPTPVPEPGYAWEPLLVQPAPATMHPGQKVALNVVLQNTGTQPWHADNLTATPMRLAAVRAQGVQPRERSSLFARDDPTWLWSGGRRIRMTTPVVAPGGAGIFTFTFTAPSLPSYPQTFVERFAPIVEDVALLDAEDIVFTTQVRPAAGPLPALPEVPALPSIPLPTLSPVPVPTETPSVVPSPLPTPPTPPVTRCPTSAEPGPQDVYPPAVAVGYSPSSPLLAGKVASPQAVAYGFGKIFAADTAGDRIAKTDPAGFVTEYFGSSGSGPGQMRWPGGIAISDSAVVFVADTGNNRIQMWSLAGVRLGQFGEFGSQPGQFIAPRGLSIIPNGPLQGHLVVADTGNDRIQIISRDTLAPIAVIGSSGAGAGQLSSPSGAGVWGDHVFVADAGNQRIQRLTLNGTFAGGWGGDGDDAGCTSLPSGILVNAHGVFVAEGGSGRIEHFTRWGLLIETIAGLSNPTAIAMDATARLYVSEAGAGRVGRLIPAASIEPASVCREADPVECIT